MSYVITGATGNLGGLIVEHLLARGADPAAIVATGRDSAKLAPLAARGVDTRVADYDDDDALRAAIGTGDKVVLISGMVPGQRVEQHRNVIEVAKTQGAALVAYTGITNSDSLDILLAEDHQATEAILVESGVPYALLRNDLYLDLYVGQIPMAVQNGAIVGSAGTGRLSAALRSEYAEATAALLLQDDSTGTYELGGDQAFSLSEVAEAIAAATGTAVAYRDLPTDTYEQLLLGAGMPAPLAHVMADSHRAIANNALVTHSGDLSRLLGRPATTMPDAIRAAASR